VVLALSVIALVKEISTMLKIMIRLCITGTSALCLTAGYDKNSTNGFFIRSKDGRFRLNIGHKRKVNEVS